MDFNKIHFNEIDSTNKYIKENYKTLNHGDVVTADHQTAGKGRKGRAWEDNGSALFSILLKDELDVARMSELSLVAAVAVFHTVCKYVKDVAIKWPNDILIDQKKVSGILLESVIQDGKVECLVLGIGVNVNTKTFETNLHYKAASIWQTLGHELNIDIFIDEILKEFAALYEHYKQNNRIYIDIINQNSFINGKDVILKFSNNTQLVTAQKVLENGNLSVLMNEEEHEITSGEVSVIYYY